MKFTNFASLREIIHRALETFNTPACSVTIIQHDEILFSEGFGTCTLDKIEPVNADTSYAIASMSKSTAALALAILQEQGRFQWEDRIQNWLPTFAFMDPFATREMTVKDLLTHRCGLRSESAGTLWYGSDYSREEVVHQLRYLRPISSFREKFAYQNVCYLVASLLIEKICGQSWDHFTAQEIFAPLQMTRTFPTFGTMKRANIGNIATPHARIHDIVQQIPYRDHDNIAAGASVHSTSADLAKYLQLFLSPSPALIQPETYAMLHEMHSLIPRPALNSLVHPRLMPTYYGYGLGWFVQDYCGRKRVGHSGGVDGMRGRMEFFPNEQLGVVVLTNSEDRRAYQSILYSIFDLMLNETPLDWVSLWEHDQETALSASSTQLPSPIPETNLSHPLESYTGDYRDSAYGEINIRQKAGKLTLQFSHTPAFGATLSHHHYDTFRLHWHDPYIPDGLITFQTNAQGNIRAFHLDQPRLLDVDFSELDEWISKAEH